VRESVDRSPGRMHVKLYVKRRPGYTRVWSRAETGVSWRAKRSDGVCPV